MFRYRFAGRERWMTLGNYPDMSLAAARIEAREKRLILDKRRDPLFVKQEAEEAQRAAIAAQKARQTFRDLAEDWYSTEINPRRLKHPKVPLRESPSFGGANLLAMKLLLALGVRKGELLGAQWSEFDLDSASPTWRLPASRTKTG